MTGDMMKLSCALLGTLPVMLPGEHDHAEGFDDGPTVLPIVLEFLERIAEN